MFTGIALTNFSLNLWNGRSDFLDALRRYSRDGNYWCYRTFFSQDFTSLTYFFCDQWFQIEISLCANCYDRTNGIWDDRRLNLSINTLTIRRPSLSLVVTRLPLGSGFFSDWGALWRPRKDTTQTGVNIIIGRFTIADIGPTTWWIFGRVNFYVQSSLL